MASRVGKIGQQIGTPKMSIAKQDLVERATRRLDRDREDVEETLDAVSDEIYQSLKQGNSVNIPNFGTF